MVPHRGLGFFRRPGAWLCRGCLRSRFWRSHTTKFAAAKLHGSALVVKLINFLIQNFYHIYSRIIYNNYKINQLLSSNIFYNINIHTKNQEIILNYIHRTYNILISTYGHIQLPTLELLKLFFIEQIKLIDIHSLNIFLLEFVLQKSLNHNTRQQIIKLIQDTYSLNINTPTEFANRLDSINI